MELMTMAEVCLTLTVTVKAQTRSGVNKPPALPQDSSSRWARPR